MPNPVRLVIASSVATSAISAINVDTQAQVLINDESEHYSFFTDCIGLDQALADRYDNDQAISCSMTSDDWNSWLEHFHHSAEHSPYVWLTVSQEGNQQDYALSAMELITKREIVAVEEKLAFVRDVQGWNESAYQKNLSFICRMSAENWTAWLEMWEATELPSNTATRLTA